MSVFAAVTLHGRQVPGALPATLAWNRLPAATLVSWSVGRRPDALDGSQEWRLDATLAQVNTFAVTQRPLLVTVPWKGGFFVFPVRQLQLRDENRRVTATLDAPRAG